MALETIDWSLSPFSLEHEAAENCAEYNEHKRRDRSKFLIWVFDVKKSAELKQTCGLGWACACFVSIQLR